ncbi:MAG: hypothetical protein JWM43_770 [Acidobacteriaceae bacterium]|nr:hypothetical protein [Acidobacteriaceae bacterium]
MSLLSWADNRTLLGCQFLLSGVYSVVFFIARRMYPHLRGTGYYSLGFFSALLGIALLAMRGNIPYFASVVFANTFIFSGSALLYLGTLQFFRSQRSSTVAWVFVAVATAFMSWYTVVDDKIVVRVVIIAVAVLAIRSLLALELLRSSAGRPFLKLFAAFIFLTGFFGVIRSVLTLVRGTPANYMQHDTVQTGTLLLDVFLIFTLGLFLVLLIGNEFMLRVELQSQQDSVSGLLNRRGIEQRLTVELTRIARSSQKLSVALIDVDHFKRINDTAGHAAGDAALRNVAEAVSTQLRAYDALGRYGGDEFLLLLPQTAVADATLVAGRFAQSLRAISPKLNITLSIGITEARSGEAVADLLLRADEALYSAKHAGRNCIRTVLAATCDPIVAPSQPVLSKESKPHLVAS